MKILTAQQIRELDTFTIEHEPIASLALMERASRAFTDWFIQHFSTAKKVAVVCGTGNNGGDGLAISRMLLEHEYAIDVFVVKPNGNASDDFMKNEEHLKSLTTIRYITNNSEILELNHYDIIIDGIFGSGLSRVIDSGIYKEVIEQINSSPAIKVAIDIPSGLFADKHTSGGVIIEAGYTVTFQVPKLAFLFPSNHHYVGEWVTVDIGLSNEGISALETSDFLLQEEDITAIIKERKPFTHKGDYGKCLLISGSYGKMGAAVLAATAALRSGAGLLTVHSPRCGYDILQLAAPEAMFSPDDDEKIFSAIPDVMGYDVIGIGPGLGTDDLTSNALAELLGHWENPIVIDADGLNLLANNRHLLDLVPKNSILTPHPKEFERLAGESSNDFERLELLRSYALEHQFYVILKGYRTAIATPDGDIYFNQTGNPGMATGGTGDVLTGIITSLLGQKYASREAAFLGTWLHGLAGDLATGKVGMDSLIASDVVKFLPHAFQYLLKNKIRLKGQ